MGRLCWGDLCEEDRRANEAALRNGTRVLSAYQTRLEDKTALQNPLVTSSGPRRQAPTTQNSLPSGSLITVQAPPS